MLAELHQVLRWIDKGLPSERQIFISDSLSTDGAFLLLYFMGQYLRANQKVILIALEQSLLYYAALSRKMGINLLKEYSAGRFIYVDGMTCPYDWTGRVFSDTRHAATDVILTAMNAHPFLLSSSENCTLQPLYILIRQIVDSISADEQDRICLIIDNVSAFSNILDAAQICAFVDYCRLLLGRRNRPVGTVVCLAHADCSSVLSNTMKYRSDLVIQLEGFKMGRSIDEDGLIRFVRPLCDEQVPPELYFKVVNGVARLRVVPAGAV